MDCRYLVPADLTVGQFVYVIRKRIRVSPEKAIFMFVKNVLPPTGASHQQVGSALDHKQLTTSANSCRLSTCIRYNCCVMGCLLPDQGLCIL